MDDTATVTGSNKTMGDTVGGIQLVAEETFRLLVESVHDYGIFLMDPSGIIQSWNAGAERMKGYSASEIIGKNFSLFYLEDDIRRNHPQFELEHALLHGRYEEEGWRKRKDGTNFWASVVITSLRNSQGRLVGFAKVTRDLTERKEAEDLLKVSYANLEKRVEERTLQLSKANEELEKAIQIRDEFMSIASHELRTPLTPLKLQIQNMLSNIKRKTLKEMSDERLEKLVTSCDKAVIKLSSLIDNLLDVSRITSGNLNLSFERNDLVETIVEIMERHRSEFSTSMSVIKLDLPPAAFGVFDKLRVEQVFLNLLTNSLKYGNNKPVDIIVKVDQENLSLIVRDRGIGIPDEDQSRIFERFERASSVSDVSGLGLGLYITKQIVDAHGGTIQVTSNLNQGSTFEVKLPLTGKRL